MSDTEFADFVASRWRALFRTAVLLTGSPDSAEDLAQDALVKVYANRSHLRAARALEAYTRRTMMNEYLSSLRRRHIAEQRFDETAHGIASLDHAEVTVRRAELQQALSTLSPRQRAVVVLRYFDGLSIEETADAMRSSQGAVKKQAHRALNALRQRLVATEALASHRGDS